MYSQTDYEASLRTLIPDQGFPSEASRIFGEDLTGQVVGGAGSTFTFTLSHINIAASGAMVNVNQAGYTTSGFTVDTTNGLLIFPSGSQPTLSTTYPNPTQLLCTYYFQQFYNSDLDTFINYGLGKFSYPPMTGDNADTTYQNLNSGFYNCVLLYAASQAFYSLFSKYSRITNISAQGKSAGKGSVAQRYEELAKEYNDKAELERVSLYGARQGRSTAANNVIRHNLSPGTRWRSGRSSY